MLLEDIGSDHDPAAAEALLLAVTGELFAEEVRWQPGAEELIDGIRAAGLKIALVTNSPRSVVDLALGLLGGHRFDVTVAGDEVANGKPDPEPYLMAMDSLGLTAADCLAVEDSPSGTEAAIAAGIAVLVVPSGVAVPEGPAGSSPRPCSAPPSRNCGTSTANSADPDYRPTGRVKVTVSASGPADPDVVWDRYIHPRVGRSGRRRSSRSTTRTTRFSAGGRRHGARAVRDRRRFRDSRDRQRKALLELAGQRRRHHPRDGARRSSRSVDAGAPATRTTLEITGPAPIVLGYLPIARIALGRLVRWLRNTLVSNSCQARLDRAARRSARKVRRGQRFLRHNAPVYLTITSTASPATDLGYLLHKHPGRAQSIDLPVGRAHVFYPEATPRAVHGGAAAGGRPDRAGPRQAIRRRVRAADPLRQRPALRRVIHVGGRTGQSVPHRHGRSLRATAGTGRRRAAADRADPVPANGCSGRRGRQHRTGAPAVRATRAGRSTATELPLDPQLPEWGPSRYVDLQLTGNHQLAHALSHCMCCCRCWTTPSTTGWGMTR